MPFAWCFIFVLLPAPVIAQESSQQSLARAQALLRQVSVQKQELETANSRLSAEVDALQTKLSGAEARLKDTSLNLASEQRKASRTTVTLDDARERLMRTEDTLREAIERLRSTNADLQQSKQEGADFATRLARAESELADSERKNLQLYQANVELLQMYRDKGPLTALFQREPVTGLKNVEIENTLLEYQAKLETSLRGPNRDAARDAAVPAAGDR